MFMDAGDGMAGMGNSGVLIELEGVVYTYPGGNVPVLDHVDFSFHESERIGLIGPNGSGKTTLFHIIMGLVKPSAGTVRVFGKTMVKEKDFVMARQGIGLLFQDSDDQLFCPTVLEDVAFGPLNTGKTFSEARDIAQKTLENVGLSGFEQRITNKLSGGEKRLVALASVLAMEPRALLLDEPTTGLDETTKARLMTILNQLNKPLILISHEYDFLSKTTEILCSMKQGHITKNGGVHFHHHIHAHVHGDDPHKHE